MNANAVVCGPERTGDWMQTFSGRQFWPLDPRGDDIDIVDIAAALSKLNRYGGHTLRFYSVAEHCVLLTRHARDLGWPLPLQLCVLLHDASEAYLSDIIRPVKRHLPHYGDIESRLMAAVCERFCLPWPMPDAIKRIDDAILSDEQEQGMAPPPAPWGTPAPLGVELQFWAPDRAFAAFMMEFLACGGARAGHRSVAGARP